MEQQDKMSKHLACDDTHERRLDIAMALGLIFVVFALAVMTGAKPSVAAGTIFAGLAVIWAVHVVVRIILSIKSGAHS